MKKTVFMPMRITEEQKKRWGRAAKKMRMTMPVFIRSCADAVADEKLSTK